MNFYDEAIEAKNQLQIDLVDKRRRVIELVQSNKSVQEIATLDIARGVIYDHDITTLETADPYFWEPRITQMVLATGQQLPTAVEFDASWLQGRAGYWWFGRSSPLIGVDNTGQRKYVNALLWNMNPNGSVTIGTFHIVGRTQYPLGSLTWDEGVRLSDAMDRAGTLERDLITIPDILLRDLALNLARRTTELAKEVVKVAGEAKRKHEEIVALVRQLNEEDKYSTSEYDKDVERYSREAETDLQRVDRFSAENRERLEEWTVASKNALQLFACGCLWLKQKIITVVQAPLSRAAQRRLARAGIEPKCLVVELRRQQYTGTSSPEHSAVDWAWQWAVRGHWREQPTKEGTKLIWIHPYIKGPEDKPLKPDVARVFAVRR